MMAVPTTVELQHIDAAAEAYIDAAITALRSAKRSDDMLDAQNHIRRAERLAANAITAYEIAAYALLVRATRLRAEGRPIPG